MAFSWQPRQETCSPGMPTSQLRMSCTARPSASSGWMEIGVLTGAVKKTVPRSSTGAVPSTYFASQLDSTPMPSCEAAWLKP